jgi:hypothetical protein
MDDMMRTFNMASLIIVTAHDMAAHKPRAAVETRESSAKSWRVNRRRSATSTCREPPAGRPDPGEENLQALSRPLATDASTRRSWPFPIERCGGLARRRRYRGRSPITRIVFAR